MAAFPSDPVEDALKDLGSTDPTKQDAANQFLCDWSNSDLFIPSCFSLIKSTTNIQVRQIVLLAFATKLIDKWNTLDINTQSEIKQYFLKISLTGELPSEIRDPMMRVVVIIALYDFPQKWESFLVDLLFVDREANGGELFIRSMQIIAMYVKEVESCTYLTSDRLLQLEFLLLSFLDMLLPIADNLLLNINTAPIGLSIMNGLLQWGNITEVLTPEIFDTLVNKCLLNDLTYEQTLRCLSFGFFDRNDVAPIFEKIAPSLIHSLAVLPEYKSQTLEFITKFLKKYICLLELYCFAQVVPDSTQKILELKETIFKTKQGTISMELTELQTKSIPEVRHLFEVTLLKPPDDSYVDDFWPLWRDLARRLFKNSRENTDQPNLAFLLIQPLLPLIFFKLTEYLPTCIESGRLTNIDAQLFFEYFIRTFPSEAMSFITSSNLTPALVFLVGLLKQSEEVNTYVNMFAARLLEANVPSDFWEAMMFTFSKMATVLNPEHFAKLMTICNKALFEGDESLQISAAQAIFVTFTLCPHRIDSIKLIQNIGYYATSLADDATVKMMKLCTFIANKCNLPLDSLSTTILSILPTRTETALRSMSEMAIAASEKCCLLFEPIWEPLFGILSTENDFVEYAYLALTSSIANCRIEDIGDQFQTFLNIIIEHPEWSELTFELFANVRRNRSEFDEYANYLEELAKASDLSASLFKMISAFSPGAFDLQFVVRSIILGIHELSPNIHKEALNCARNLLFSFAENPSLAELTPKIRPLLVDAVVSSMMDAKHQLGFSRQAVFLNEVFRIGELQEDSSYTKEFYLALLKSTNEPQHQLFQQVAIHLDHIKENKTDFKESLRDFLLVMRKATPYQIGTFFGDPADDELKDLIIEEERNVCLAVTGPI